MVLCEAQNHKNKGTPPALHYLFYSVILIVINLFIIWYAWKRCQPEDQSGHGA
jgi:hypothetical protein